MNVYFACSITGGRQDAAVYQALVAAMLGDGHEVPTAILASESVVDLEEVVDPEEVYTRDTAWIRGCEALVAEVSTPSHGVGYEISYALSAGKPVLCLHRQGVKVSKMITGNTRPNLQVKSYATPGEAVGWVRSFLAGL